MGRRGSRRRSSLGELFSEALDFVVGSDELDSELDSDRDSIGEGTISAYSDMDAVLNKENEEYERALEEDQLSRIVDQRLNAKLRELGLLDGTGGATAKPRLAVESKTVEAKSNEGAFSPVTSATTHGGGGGSIGLGREMVETVNPLRTGGDETELGAPTLTRKPSRGTVLGDEKTHAHKKYQKYKLPGFLQALDTPPEMLKQVRSRPSLPLDIQA